MIFATQFKKNVKNLDAAGGEVLVQLQGYISAEQRINNLMDAGRRLIESRGSQYDWDDVDDPSLEDVNFDITRRRNYDVVDATQDVMALEQRITDRAQSNKVSKAVDEVAPDGSAVGQETSPVGEAGK